MITPIAMAGLVPAIGSGTLALRMVKPGDFGPAMTGGRRKSV